MGTSTRCEPDPKLGPDPSISGSGCQHGSGRVIHLSPGPDPNRTLGMFFFSIIHSFTHVYMYI
jgi:hypothetical protein